LATIGSQAEIKVWDLDADRLLSDEVVGHAEAVNEVGFLPDGVRIATCSRDGTTRIWDARTGRQQRILQHEGSIYALAASPGGDKLLTNGFDDTLRLWDANSGEEIYALGGHGTSGRVDLMQAAFSADAERLISFGNDLYLRTWDAGTGKAIAEHAIRPSSLEIERTSEGGLRLKEGSGYGAYGGGLEGLAMMLGPAKFPGDAKRLILATRDKRLHAFDVETGTEVAWYELEEPFREFDLSRDASLLAVVIHKPLTDSSGVERRSVLTLRRLPNLDSIWEQDLAANYSSEVRISPDGKLLGVALHGDSPGAGTRYWIAVHSTATGDEVCRIEDVPLNSYKFAFSPDGQYLAAAYTDASVLVWDLNALRLAP
jgi:WD40 repeat protein